MRFSQDDAEDVVQDAFVKAYSSPARFDGRSLFGTWFVSIALRCALMRIRSTTRKSCLNVVAINEAISVSEVRRADLDLIDREERDRARDRVIEAIAGLSEVRRDAIMAYFYGDDDTTARECAEMVGCSLSAFKTRLHLSKPELREALA